MIRKYSNGTLYTYLYGYIGNIGITAIFIKGPKPGTMNYRVVVLNQFFMDFSNLYTHISLLTVTCFIGFVKKKES